MTQFIQNPYLTVIICSRNDDHGGNTLRRTQVSFSGLLQQLEKHHIESELILVDWNPPADRPLLKKVIQWPTGLKYCTVRVIEVPPSIHQRYKHHHKIRVHVTVGVNSGVRRARGAFILPGTIDLLYSDELMSFIGSRALKADERYRVDRCDVDRNVLQYDTLTEQLDYCKKNIIWVYSFNPNSSSSGDGFPRLHTKACGDFQLMSRHYWHLLRGYRETDIAPAHVDGLLSYASYAAGVREVILNDPIRLYHIDHYDKFNERLKIHRPRFEEWVSFPLMPSWVSRKLIALYRKFMDDRTRSEVYGIPTLSLPEYHKLCRQIVAGKGSYILNDETWGLGGIKLSETVVSIAEWDVESYQSGMPQP